MTMPPGPPQPGARYPGPAPPQGYGAKPRDSAPVTLGIIALVCAVLCSPAGIVLGLVAAATARELRVSTRLPTVAWVLGSAMFAFLILGNIVRYVT